MALFMYSLEELPPHMWGNRKCVSSSSVYIRRVTPTCVGRYVGPFQPFPFERRITPT